MELCGGDVAGSYCARLLRSIGFRVVKVEPPGGDPIRGTGPLLGDGTSALFHYLNAAKESVVGGRPRDGGLALDLVDAADVVILAADGDADAVDADQRWIAERRPSCVRVVVSPFGLTGPYRNEPHIDLTDWAASGYMFITGDADKEPLQGGAPFPAYTTGLTAAIGAMACWRDARAGGPGRLVDVGTFESMAALHQFTITVYSHTGFIKRRAGNRHADAHHPVAFLECADGWVCICAPAADQWRRLTELAGVPELAADPRFVTPGDRYENADAADAALRPWLMAHSAADVAARLQEARVPASPVVDLSAVLTDEHVRARGFFHDVDIAGAVLPMPGSTVSVGDPVPWSAAPGLGEHTDAVATDLAARAALAGGRS